MARPLERIAIVGSGNWGSAVSRIIAANAASHASEFDPNIRMWVFEEELPASFGDRYAGRKLSEVINTEHINVKYLPGHPLPASVRAVTDVAEAVAGATCVVFVLPHQFLAGVLPAVSRALAPTARLVGSCDAPPTVSYLGLKVISLIKGIDVEVETASLRRISDYIRAALPGADVAVLSGANVANEVAEGQFCEATVGCEVPANALMWQRLFQTDYFRIETTDDVAGVELCGALKNIVALGAGFSDALGFGGNTKAAILRIGLLEMRRFCHQFYGKGSTAAATPATGDAGAAAAAVAATPASGVSAGSSTSSGRGDGIRDETFLQSCGIADLITTALTGRNRKVAEAFVRTGRTWDDLEKEMLGGQKLQGTLTADGVRKLLDATRQTHKYPLFYTISKIMRRELVAGELVHMHLHAAAAAADASLHVMSPVALPELKMVHPDPSCTSGGGAATAPPGDAPTAAGVGCTTLDAGSALPGARSV